MQKNSTKWQGCTQSCPQASLITFLSAYSGKNFLEVLIKALIAQCLHPEGTLLRMHSRVSELVSVRVAVLYNHREASNPLDFSTCIFPQTQCAPCPCDHLLASLQDQDPFSDKFCQKCKNCLLTSYHHLPLSVRHSLSLWLSVLTWLFRVPLFILQGSLSGIFQPPVSLRVCIFLQWKGNILVCASSLAAQTD